jgi:glycosyltransferase involved in cell wall biosynthesis
LWTNRRPKLFPPSSADLYKSWTAGRVHPIEYNPPLDGLMRILFITKKRSAYGCSYGYAASGLLNSARFIVDMLNASGIEAKLVDVTDNNDIDHEVSKYQPSVVIVEAFWVVPEKFDVLERLHPNVRWIVRGHSDIPFLAGEGIAVDWIAGYVQRGVLVAFNDPRTVESVESFVPSDSVLYLPNYYPLCDIPSRPDPDGFFNVGCFGAIRPLKNHLLQAVAAIRFADKEGKNLSFHINATRCEEGGLAILRNLRSLFANTEYELVEHSWYDHNEFLQAISRMDVEMAVSFSETFCITAADAVAAGVPVICSSEIPWAARQSIVPTTDVNAMVKKLQHLHPAINHMWNHRNLHAYSKKSKQIWLQEFSG